MSLYVLAATLATAASAGAVRRVTVSGQSSGGDMAMTHLFAYSASVDGAAVASGSPYGCDKAWLSGLRCSWGGPNVEKTIEFAHKQFDQGFIDDPANLSSTPVLLFRGRADLIVGADVMHDVRSQLQAFVASDKVDWNFDTWASHVWSLDHGSCKCGRCVFSSDTDLCCDVENCNYDLSGSMLRHFLGEAAVKPRVAKREELYWIEQAPYFAGPAAVTWILKWALAYVPTGCEGRIGACRVHVDYIGCTADFMGDRRQWAVNLDLHEYAEANDIIVVHPQVSGCWGSSSEDEQPWNSREGGLLKTVVNLVGDLSSALSSALLIPNDQFPKNMTAVV